MLSRLPKVFKPGLFHSADYFRELDKATVKSHPEERQIGDFDWLVGQYHMDEGLLYKSTRMVVRRGLIVGFRSLITAGKVQVEDKTPIYIADLQSLTEEFSRWLSKKSGAHDDGASGGDSTVTAGVAPPIVEPENPSEMNVPPSGVPESGEKRVRTRRVPDQRVYAGRDPYGRCGYTTPSCCR